VEYQRLSSSSARKIDIFICIRVTIFMAAFSPEPATGFQQLKEAPLVKVKPALRPRMTAAKQLELQQPRAVQTRATAAERQPELPARRAWQPDKPVSDVCC
jgi:hypothetical protein